MIKIINITRSSGFTLIELLVVVAILGILSSVGVISYNGYVTSAKKKTAENILQQVSLAQLEYFTNTGEYYPDGVSDDPAGLSSAAGGPCFSENHTMGGWSK